MQETQPPILSIIILNRNTADHLVACLRSLTAHRARRGDEVILVDNASSDGSVEKARAAYPGLRVVANAEDIGFARGNNQGLRMSRGRYVLFLNPDTRFLSAELEVLFALFRRHPRLGLLGCRLRNPDMSSQPSCHAFPTLPRLVLRKSLGRTGIAQTIVYKHPLFRRCLVDGWSPDSESRVDWILGAFMLGPREPLLGLGGFDESFSYYATDVELCWRIRAAGFQVWYSPAYEIIHYGNPNWTKERLAAVRDANCQFVSKYRGRLSGHLMGWAYRGLKLIESK